MRHLILRRVALVPLQALGVVSIAFILLHLLPGNPARLIAGPLAPQSRVDQVIAQLGLNKPLPTQYADYISQVLRGNLGVAFSTGNPVVKDIEQRGPATLTLITLAIIGVAIVSALLTTVIVMDRNRIARRLAAFYGFVAGTLPDFWIGLGLIFLFYYEVPLGAAPSGQFSPIYVISDVSGIAPVDALIAGNVPAFFDALNHLILPVATLVIVYSGYVVRVTVAAANRTLNSEFLEYATAWGIAPWRRAYYAARHDMPVFVTALGATYAALLGGAVLVETVFSWGGLGQYAVDAIRVDDTAAVEGFVIVAGIFVVIVYTVIDVVNMILDPRVRR
jgi:ABC-type dipeptide/oligopeptide/nickel transport system permease component